MVTGEKSESLLSTKVAQLCHLGPGAFSTDDRDLALDRNAADDSEGRKRRDARVVHVDLQNGSISKK